MKVTRLRLHGFKSFVEAADVPIEAGLTGIVGPNGCGKSNLVEALRFVMGESSYKALRGSGMDDVIFAGSAGRPARNLAEVTLVAEVDGSGKDSGNTLEITRRIEREAGSVYRINGRETRARDVQLLFADAATGPRSSALVRQGQIGELIAAKPQQRRSILEDAAGISGLHSRRAEAELKLKAAESNLERLEDVQAELGLQLEGLRRQARQAVRYRTLSAEIRRTEALASVLEWDIAAARLAQAEADLARAGQALAEAASAQGQAARDEAVAAQGLPALRNQATAAAAALQRLRLSAQEIEREQARLKARSVELAARRVQIVSDLAHEGDVGADATAALRAIEAEQTRLLADRAAYAAQLAEAGKAAEAAAATSARSEVAYTEAAAALAAAASERAARERAVHEARARLARLGEERQATTRELATLRAERAQGAEPRELAAKLAAAEQACAGYEAEAQAAEAALAAAREAERRSRIPVESGEKALTALQAEARTLAQVLDLGKKNRFAPVMDTVDVTPGYEAALVAALGDDLETPLDPAATAYWGESGTADADPQLPEGAEPLTRFVRGPDTLTRRLRQIGVVSESAGPELAEDLAAGQRLVSLSGALWRWDGLRVKAGASTASARRLEQRNRVAALVGEMRTARLALTKAADLHDTGKAIRVDAERFERESRETLRQSRKNLESLRATLAEAERRAGLHDGRIAALTGGLERLDEAESNARGDLSACERAVAALADTVVLAGKREALQGRLDKDRAAAAASRLQLDQLRQEDEIRTRRLEELGAERERWHARTERARSRIAEFQDRLLQTDAEIAAAADQPDRLSSRLRALADETVAAQALAADASEKLLWAEAEARSFAERARAALELLSKARETEAREAERVIAASSRKDELERRIGDTFGKPPHALRLEAGIGANAAMPEAAAVATRLERLKSERERLGAVNLRADEEADELATRLSNMQQEREDLEAAISDLRQAIQTLNREGRQRLLAAFEEVNGHFRSLFQHLFGGGTAELSLTDSADALEAGLDIIARPPGKRPQTLSLLSGGEQTLTALSLIFAVFLTNPSPICVLDEVDAPLDDANVERFCALVDEMRRRTETRFLLVTHNPITMARMDRLFGVTMAERGVSQLVSVDLETAERFREAS